MPEKRFIEVINKIDDFNRNDPNKIRVEDYEYPSELIYSQNLTEWVLKLDPNASEALQIAARGQHIGRWTIARKDYLEGRGGYLRWREDLKKFHSQKVTEFMKEAGYGDQLVSQVEKIILKKELKQNQDSQTMEDALCLVFLETQFGDLKAKTSQEKMKTIIQKTWKKMSEKAKEIALNLELKEEDKELIKKSLTLLILALSFNVSNLFAGAWTREKGEIYSKLSVSRFESDEIFGPKNNKKLPGPDFEDTSIFSYTEYGLTEKWTGIVNLSYKSLYTKALGVERTKSGLADAWLNLKRKLKEGPFVLSAQGGIKIPLGYDRLDIPPLGDGQIDIEGRLLFGKSFYPFPGYGNAEFGYRKRNGDVSDEFVYLLELGANVHKKVLLKVVLERVESQSDDTASSAGNRHPNINDEEFTKVGPAVLIFLKKGWGIEFGYENTIAGGNTAIGDTFSFGVFWQGTP